MIPATVIYRSVSRELEHIALRVSLLGVRFIYHLQLFLLANFIWDRSISNAFGFCDSVREIGISSHRCSRYGPINSYRLVSSKENLCQFARAGTGDLKQLV